MSDVSIVEQQTADLAIVTNPQTQAVISEREKISPPYGDYLAPIEHLLISSTPTAEYQELGLYDTNELLRQIKTGNVDTLELLLTPLILLKAKKTMINIDEIFRTTNQKREKAQKEKAIRGTSMSIFDSFAFYMARKSAGKKGIVPCIDINPINPINHQIGTYFKVYLVDESENIVNDDLLLNELKLNENFKDFFSFGGTRTEKLDNVKTVDFRTLSLNLPKA